MPTVKGVALTSTGAALLVVASLVGLPEAAAMGVGCLVAVIASVTMVWVPPIGPSLAATPEPHAVTVGSSGSLRITVTTRWAWPGRMLVAGPLDDGRRIRAWAPTSRGRRSFEVPVAVSSRGELTVGPLGLRRVGLLGLASRTVATAPPAVVLGWPETVPCPAPAVAASGLTDAGPRPDPASVEEGSVGSIRPYQQGDDLRRVAWAASARSSELLVRMPDHPPMRPAWSVRIDAPGAFPDDDGFELAVSVVASLVMADPDAALVTPDGARLRGTDALDELARLERTAEPPGRSGARPALVPASSRPGDAEGPVVVVTGPASAAPWPAPTGRARAATARICADPSGRGTGAEGEIVVGALGALPAALSGPW
jgi:hypothetical protein